MGVLRLISTRLSNFQRPIESKSLFRVLSTRTSASVPSLEKLISEGLGHSNYEDEGIIIQSTSYMHRCTGLMNSSIGSFVRFSDGHLGMVLELEHNTCIVSAFSTFQPRVGSLIKLAQTEDFPKQLFSLYLSTNIILRPLKVLSHIFLKLKSLTSSKNILQLPLPPPLSQHKPINEKLPTGLNTIEIFSPIGKGNRILFHGPVRTGKTKAACTVLSTLLGDLNGDEKIFILASNSANQYSEFLSSLPKKLARLQAGNGRSDEQFQRHMESKIIENIQKRVKIISPNDFETLNKPQFLPLESYIAPLCALELATEKRAEGNPVVIFFDDIPEYIEMVKKLNSDLNNAIGTPSHYTTVPNYTLPHSVESILSNFFLHSCNCAELGSLSTFLIFNASESSTEQNNILKNLEDLADCPIEFKNYSKFLNPPVDYDVIEIPIDNLNLCAYLDYQNSLIKYALQYLREFIHSGEEYEDSLDSKKNFNIHIDFWEYEENNSFKLMKKLISIQSSDRNYDLLDSLIFVRAASLYYFPNSVENYDQIISYQDTILEIFKKYHWDQYSTLKIWLLGPPHSNDSYYLSDNSTSAVASVDESPEDLLYSLDMALLNCRKYLTFLHPQL